MLARAVMATGLTTLGLFQAGLALDRPWGAAAYGGAHRGVLPGRLRLSSAVAAPVYLAVAAAVGAGSGSRVGLEALTVVMAVATVPNALSPSRAEKAWAPVCAAIAWAAWSGRPRR